MPNGQQIWWINFTLVISNIYGLCSHKMFLRSVKLIIEREVDQGAGLTVVERTDLMIDIDINLHRFL